MHFDAAPKRALLLLPFSMMKPHKNWTPKTEIEQTVRQKVLKHVSPEIGIFLSKQSLVQPQVEKDD